jgi:hypothetical protein
MMEPTYLDSTPPLSCPHFRVDTIVPLRRRKYFSGGINKVFRMRGVSPEALDCVNGVPIVNAMFVTGAIWERQIHGVPLRPRGDAINDLMETPDVFIRKAKFISYLYT